METALTKKEAMDELVAYLNGLGQGVEFTPAELAQRLSGTSGKSTPWYRMVLATDLTALGIVELSHASGRYRVAPTKPAAESLSRTEGKPITAGQLRVWLTTVPDDAPVVMSQDGEGNDFSPLAEAESDRAYVAESTWSGYILRNDELDGEDTQQVVVLWPTN